KRAHFWLSNEWIGEPPISTPVGRCSTLNTTGSQSPCLSTTRHHASLPSARRRAERAEHGYGRDRRRAGSAAAEHLRGWASKHGPSGNQACAARRASRSRSRVTSRGEVLEGGSASPQIWRPRRRCWRD